MWCEGCSLRHGKRGGGKGRVKGGLLEMDGVVVDGLGAGAIR